MCWAISSGRYRRQADTLYLVREGGLQPVYNVNKRTLKSGMGMSDVLLPGKVFSNLIEDKEVIPNVTVGFPVACIVTDLNSGKSVKYPTVARNDFLGINTEQFSFQNGYLVQAVSAVEFKEIGGAVFFPERISCAGCQCCRVQGDRAEGPGTGIAAGSFCGTGQSHTFGTAGYGQ